MAQILQKLSTAYRHFSNLSTNLAGLCTQTDELYPRGLMCQNWPVATAPYHNKCRGRPAIGAFSSKATTVCETASHQIYIKVSHQIYIKTDSKSTSTTSSPGLEEQKTALEKQEDNFTEIGGITGRDRTKTPGIH